MVRNLYSSTSYYLPTTPHLPPLFWVKKIISEGRVAGWASNPSPLSSRICHCEGSNDLLPTKPHNRTTTSAGRGMRLSVQAGKLK